MPLAFDPQAIFVPAVDDEPLPRVDVSTLQPDALRRRFAQPAVWRPEIFVERSVAPSQPLSPAAVLIPLVCHVNGLTVMLTRRASNLKSHPAQISFPGGRSESFDVDATATALREAHEEIGLDARYVEVLGVLPTYTTGTHFVVTPVIALIAPQAPITPDRREVAEVFEVPLAFLMTPAHHRRHRAVDDSGKAIDFFSMLWQAPNAAGVAHSYFLWGATAAMLRNLYRFLVA